MAQTKVQLLQPDLGDVIDFDASTLFVDGADNRIGIRNTNPQYELDVTGTINATNFRGNISVGTIDDWIVHTGDTDTKIGFPAADKFQVFAGGGPRTTVTSTGLGIGTDSPSQPLHLNRSSSGQAEFGMRLSYENTAGGGTVTNCGVLVGSTGLKFKNYNSTRHFYFETGNVAIGSNTVPTGTLELSRTNSTDMLTFREVGANALFARIGYNSASGTSILDIRSEGHMRFLTGGNNQQLRIDNTGVIETGTAIGASGFDSNARLRVGRASDCNIAIRVTGNTTSHTGIYFGDSDSASSGYIQYMHNGDYMRFMTNGASASDERLRIDSSGKIGISRTPTQHPLEIQHASEPTVSLWRGSTKGSALQAQSGGTYLYSYQNAPLIFSVNSANGFTERLRIASDGRIFTSGRTSYSGNTTCDDLVIGDGSGHRGIAISSGSSSEGGIHFGDGESGNTSYRGILGYNHADDSMQFRTAASERLRIDSTGRLLVGTSTAAGNGIHVIYSTVNSAVEFQNNTTGTGSGQGLYVGNSTSNIGYLWNYANDALVFATNNTEKLRIKSDGDIVATGNIKSNNLPGNNLVHNGEFAIWQRGTTAIYMSQNKYLADRFKAMSSSDGNGSIHQHTNVPTVAQTGGSEFAYSLRINCTTADTSLSAGHYITINHRIEGRDLRHLGFGSSGTRYVTLSFWQRSPSGTYHVSFRNASYNQYYLAAYTAANNTWEKHEITLPVRTTGTWSTDHSMGLDIQWSLGAGSNNSGGTVGSWSGGSKHAGSNQKNFYDTVGNDFYLTGVQFEKGSIATPFEHKSYGEDLRQCQRYFFTITPPVGFINATEDLGMAFTSSANEVQFPIKFPVEMRATPSIEQVTGSNYFIIGFGNLGGDKYLSGNWIVNNMSPNAGNLYTDPDSNMSSYIGQAAGIQLKNTSARLALRSEL